MDQAASVFAQRGSALYVSFKPSLSTRPLELPRMKPEMVFVIAQTFVAADKQASAPVCYNLRVVECALAAEVLAKKLRVGSLPNDAGPLNVSLRGLQDTYFERKKRIPSNDGVSTEQFARQLKELIELVKAHLDRPDGYTKEDISELLGISTQELADRYMSKFTVRADRFKLQQRALHVYSEALRVLDFMKLLQSSPDDSNADELPKELGRLMNETQDSCRTKYECSCQELDELCSLARQAGSYGSRLTGAGWGGCSVHLVPEKDVEAVRKNWIEHYYKPRFPDITAERLAEAIVISKPGSGTVVFEGLAADLTL